MSNWIYFSEQVKITRDKFKQVHTSKKTEQIDFSCLNQPYYFFFVKLFLFLVKTNYFKDLQK